MESDDNEVQCDGANGDDETNGDNQHSQERTLPEKITNVERSAATRKKVLKATISCLNDLGYEGTTVIKVALEAGVSRGAAQHQFPSKTDLIIAAAEFIVESQSKMRETMWDSLISEKESLSAIVDFSWSLQSHPDNIALLEIMMATRNNVDLRTRFAPFFEHFIQLRYFGAEKITQAIGGKEVDPELVALLRLHFSVMRGLALDALVTTDTDGIDAAIELLKQHELEVLRKIIAKHA
ncbi:MAG: TetR/AcrR family transcriptional regulator [Cellvibrionaceae bacterium]